MNTGASQELYQWEKDHLIRGPSRRSTREGQLVDGRRGSETDILRPVSVPELQKIDHTQQTAPRQDYHEVLKDGDRFLCPFPACGKTFRSKAAAFQHIPKHEQRQRLYAPTPLPDSHLNYYWPKGVPWLDAPQFKARQVPPGSLACPHAHCTEAFPTQNRLDAHIRIFHKGGETRANDKGSHMEFLGSCVLVPPFDPPTAAPVLFCQFHSKPAGKCPTCMEIDAIPGPKCPYKFYESLSVNFTRRQLDLAAKLGTSSMHIKGAKEGIDVIDMFHAQDSQCAVRVKLAGTTIHTVGSVTLEVERQASKNEQTRDFLGRPLAFVIDRNGIGWMSLKRYFTRFDLFTMKVQGVYRDFDDNFELLEFDSDRAIWVKLNSISEKLLVVRMSKEEFREKRKRKILPRNQCFFIRPVPVEVPLDSMQNSISNSFLDQKSATSSFILN